MKFLPLTIGAFLFLHLSPATAQVKLPRLVRDSMILQRDRQVRIWGWSAANERVTILFRKKTYRTRAGADSRWSILLPPTTAGGPYTMEISASNRIVLKDILFGDVWLCSGQSNMVHQLNIHDVTYARDIADANYPSIRQFLVPNLTHLQSPQNDLPSGYWRAAVGEGARPFSAVAYFFAKELYDKYKVPVGLINASVGGTPIEAWTSEEGLKDFSSLISLISKNKDSAYVNQRNRMAAASFQAHKSIDEGVTGGIKWYDVSYHPKGWHNINIPGYWEDQGIKDLNGVVWYRREIDVPAAMTGKPARAFLGRIVDADVFYINGKQVGQTGYMYPQRRYHIAADVLKEGKNMLIIRVTNTNGKGGFVPDKPYCLFAGRDTIDLKGEWQYKVGEVFEPANNANRITPLVAQNQPTALFNAMVAPLTNYAIKGVLWYQGESNIDNAKEYENLLPALIHDWRQQWKTSALPFLYVQLPGFLDYNYLPSESNWAVLRNAQLKTLDVPNTAMAVAIDLGEWNDIHPDNKKDVGVRLALAAEKLVYGENIIASGPLFQSYRSDENKIILKFSNTGSGLVSHDGEALAEFAIAGIDKKFVWAKAKIEGDSVVVWSDKVPEPKFVRYAWADNPVNPNLYNREGLPASPFATGN